MNMQKDAQADLVADWPARVFDFVANQSLHNRAALGRADGQLHRRHWSAPILFGMLRLLSYPLENRLFGLGLVIVVLFAPIF